MYEGQGAGMDIFRTDVLAGKSILVTGGGSGLGLEISKALHAKGATVHICGRRASALEAAAAAIAADGSGNVHRSAEVRVGKAWVRTVRSWWVAVYYKKKNTNVWY